MKVCKTALRILLRHPLYLLIYVVWLSAMSLFIGIGTQSVETPDVGTYDAAKASVVIVDRDRSELSAGVADYLAQRNDVVAVEDDERALQNAVATGYADYVAFIPAGFGGDFVDSVDAGTDTPAIDTAVSYGDMAAVMVDSQIDEYLGLVALDMRAGSTVTDAIDTTAASMARSADVDVYVPNADAEPVDAFRQYLLFVGYPLMIALIVLIGVMMKAFNTETVHRRNLAGPLSSLSMSVQIASACLVVTVVITLWFAALGTIVFQSEAAQLSATGFAGIIGSLFCYGLVGTALGFLFGTLTTSELAYNAGGNIIGMVFSFMSGAWISLDLLSDGVRSFAAFLPGYYFCRGVEDGLAGTVAWGDMGIMLLYAAVLFAVAVLVARMKRQTTVKSTAKAGAAAPLSA